METITKENIAYPAEIELRSIIRIGASVVV
jgi:hypothetical protein